MTPVLSNPVLVSEILYREDYSIDYYLDKNRYVPGVEHRMICDEFVRKVLGTSLPQFIRVKLSSIPRPGYLRCLLWRDGIGTLKWFADHNGLDTFQDRTLCVSAEEYLEEVFGDLDGISVWIKIKPTTEKACRDSQQSA